MSLPMAKEQDKVRLVLQKQNAPPGFKINMKLFADVSGSFKDEFTKKLPSGGYIVDPFFTAALAIAGVIDPDRNIQIIGFSDRALDTGDYSVDTETDIRTDFLNRAKPILWGSTDYAKALEALLKSKAMEQTLGGMLKGLFSFGKKKTAEKKEAFLVLFVSDGEDMGSAPHFISQLNELAKIGTFVVLIGANSDKKVKFNLMQKAAAEVEGCTFHRLTELASLSTDQLYDRIFDTEFKRWLEQLPAEYKN
ncbi:VWA domain-containing protein [Iodobacter ciconiae]|uniref:VWA domain-containing protein n=1 Tax=Iodobacter ciconiae TaxID=2496266 RepID=A0A3S8ZVG9_9NEIS|nr:VWA domain-containing protein [Iodobacter ciconiae]AZN37438.1 VWA domain-containing protein [Iodobacter ciconiae]